MNRRQFQRYSLPASVGLTTNDRTEMIRVRDASLDGLFLESTALQPGQSIELCIKLDDAGRRGRLACIGTVVRQDAGGAGVHISAVNAADFLTWWRTLRKRGCAKVGPGCSVA